ncbi:DUF1428 family protein [Sphingomonas sp. MAH-20]|uniref:DUF1428 family protein n=2 Tax=Sphingomonadaceae TaxID=41297 RepID=A0A6I4J2L3_9SPHN|nr:DUF1428 domain-containing protein [Sphingomonas sp. CGMCC 1.13658]MVO78860.1 DUF1428 family protein [Sphingomonas horti]
MTYVEGFLVPVPADKKDAYRAHARGAAPLLLEFGARRMVESWGDDLPDGKVTDFKRAVQAEAGEAVVFSWFEYPSKDARDAANQRMMSDPRMEQLATSAPFDGKRMIFGGFEAIVDEGAGQGSYIDGFVVPVLPGKGEAYRAMAAKAAPVFREHGALRVIEAMADDVPKGRVTDFYRAVKAEEGEAIVFSFIEWPDKATRDAGWQKMMADERMKPEGDMPFAGPRMFWGGFEPILDTAKVSA